jgi:mycothiol synthase
VTARPLTADDAPTVAALINRTADADGAGWVEAGDMLRWLTAPGARPEFFRVFEDGGEIVAYADLYVAASAADRGWLDVRIPAERRGGTLAREALAWAEATAAAAGVRLLRAQVASTAGLDTALAERGFRTIRHSFDMEIALDQAPPAPEWPDGIEVRPLAPGEEERAYEAADESFEDHWEHVRQPFAEWLHHSGGDGLDPSLWFLALDRDEVAGVCLCRERARAGERIGWVSTLGVRRPWRRHGLGRALLLHAFRAFRDRGLVAAGLDVDGESLTGAVRLYERAGMHVASRSDTWELVLR